MTSFSPEKNKENKQAYERVVFVTRLSAIGDVIIAMRAIALLKKNNYYPILVTSLSMKDIALRTFGSVSFICLDENKQLSFYYEKKQVTLDQFSQLLKSIQKKEKDILLDLQKTSRSKFARSLLQKENLFSFEKIYSVDKQTLLRSFLVFNSWLSITQKKRTRSPNVTRIHTLQEDIIKKLVLNDKEQFISLTEKENILEKSDAHIEKRSGEAKYICIFPGASGFIKMWPKENFRTLVSFLIEQTSFHIYLCGASSLENEIAEFINEHKNVRITNLVSTMSLNETLDLIAGATYILTNDSFAAHAADAFFIPATVFFGSTSPSFGFVPLYKEINIEYLNLSCSPCTRHGKGDCHFGNLKCLTDIEPQKVLSDILKKRAIQPDKF